MLSYICDGTTIEAENRLTYRELAERVQGNYPYRILLAQVGGNLKELNKRPKSGTEIHFLTMADKAGYQTYARTASYLMVAALTELFGANENFRVKIEFAAGKGSFANVYGAGEVNAALAEQVDQKMRAYVEAQTPIEKHSIGKKEAIAYFKDHGMLEKARLFGYRRSSSVNVYDMGSFRDYCYGYMLPDAGYVENFKVYACEGGLVLQLAEMSNPSVVPEYVHESKIFGCQMESANWGRMLGVESIGNLNDQVVKGTVQELILVQEALQEQKIGEIARMIAGDPNKKFIMIAGPSSSGKTSFSHRLSIQLRTLGLHPHPIATDNYFVDREKTPLDENGNYNFECLEAIDVEQFNKDMTELLEGKTVELPCFNFKQGKREYKGDFMKLGEGDILVIEGIHGLNDKLSYSLSAENKFKIYISALTQMNIDDHNRITSTDGRLIRRMVRDFRTRGTAAQKTMAMWASVNRGEREYIFPYQESADVVFNSALIYELAVLKPYAEPLLYHVPEDAPEYPEAKRLLKFFEYFLTIGTDDIPKNSLLREFVGGSVFNVG